MKANPLMGHWQFEPQYMNGKAGSVSPFQDCTVDDLIAYRKVAEIIDAKTVTDLGDLAAVIIFVC